MLYLLETAAGYALFSKPKGEAELLKTYAFQSMDEAVESSMSLGRGEIPENLDKFVSGEDVASKDTLAVGDQRLAEALAERLGRKVVCQQGASLRSNMHRHFGMTEAEYSREVLCLAHKISMRKVAMAPEKIDTMVIQSIALLSDLDKDINMHCMRLREWYSFHFPELSGVIEENREYLRALVLIGNKDSLGWEKEKRLEELLGDRASKIVKLAETSMGTAMTDADMQSIVADAKSILKSHEYREELCEYIRAKMETLAPNLMALVGEQVGARLIAKAGSLFNLAKLPSSTIQVLGAEKALFQALRSKSNTPKYGLIFGTALVGQASAQYKGKIARALAAKISLVSRIDALCDSASNAPGLEIKKQLEKRIRDLEHRSRAVRKIVRRTKHKIEPGAGYDDSKDVKMVKRE
jgi:nucleolar protein 58